MLFKRFFGSPMVLIWRFLSLGIVYYAVRIHNWQNDVGIQTLIAIFAVLSASIGLHTYMVI